ncbi:MAG TPA: hypothetical protein VK030_07750, partial [Actinomycetales bacterium]|nr:hypothetical protein [Actinomycetales bacterium]
LEYACGLIADIRENNPKVRDWELRIGDDSPKEMLQAMAAASLVGGATGGGADVSDKMQEAGAQVVRGISMLSEEHIQKGVVEMARQCDAR